MLIQFSLIFLTVLLGQTVHAAISSNGSDSDNSVPTGVPQSSSPIPGSNDLSQKRPENQEPEHNEVVGEGPNNSSPKTSSGFKEEQFYQMDINTINSFARKINKNIFKTSSGSDKTKGGGNSIKSLIWSPFSVYQSLVPLFYGADGDTRKELKDILFANQSEAEDQDMRKPIRIPSILEKADQRISSVTGLFTRQDLTLNSDYVRQLQENVRNVELENVDFFNRSRAAGLINSWVEERTKGLIHGAVDEGQMEQNMFMMIVNCVRFKAPWQSQFDPSLTELSDFHGASSPQKVQMMHKVGPQFYGEFPRRNWLNRHEDLRANSKNVKPFKVIELGYEGTDLKSLFILPSTTDGIADTMDFVQMVGVGRIMNDLSPAEVDLKLPKFKLTSDVDVAQALEEGGLRTLFSPSYANLSKIFAPPSHLSQSDSESEDSSISDEMKRFIPPPYLSKIVHRTVFEVSEEGTSAGAVTSLSIVPLSALGNQEPIKFHLNRPFILMLVKNDTVLFEGIVADLKGSSEEVGDVESPTRNGISSSADKTGNETNNDDDYRAWWKKKGIPEYLKLNITAKQPSSTPPSSSAEADKAESTPLPEDKVTTGSKDVESVPESKPKAPAASGSPPPPASSLPPNSFIQFTKFQQPEPKDPDGIRFPMTAPFTRVKSQHVRPRYDHGYYDRYYHYKISF